MPYGEGILQIVGNLTSKAPAVSILKSDGSTWTYLGNSDIAGEPTGDAEISVANPNGFDEGAVFILKIGVGTHGLGTLFGSGFTLLGGEVKGMITPEPATLSLLVLGGMAVLARRRRRHAA
jgi:hypothetical protein